jgi:phospholipid/cholesterol/gamma-HCH transport system permease protein
MRWGEFWSVIQEAGPSALPIVTLISFLVGLILAFLGATVLTQFGAGIYTAHLVGFGMLRELGAMMTAIIMVGRTGAAFAARIGTMRVGEELDAFQTLGIPISDYIVLPRLLALFLMMPLLTLYADVVGIGGGMLISMTLQDVTPRLFMNTLITAVHLDDFLIGILKGTVFGVIIAITGCLRGVQCGSNAEAVGRATTSAVVTGTTLVIMANALIDWLATIG